MRTHIGRALRVARLVRRAARTHHASVPAVAKRALRLHRLEGFELLEAAPLGLLDPRISEEALGTYTSRRALRPIQGRLNAASLSPLTEDKGVFYLFCRNLGLPIPDLYALYYRDAAGWAIEGTIVESRDGWQALLERLPEEFVVKPARASFGLGVTLFRREAGAFVDHLGRRETADELLDRLACDPDYDSFVVQQRLHNHSSLVELSGSSTLQTARIHAVLERGGEVRVVEACLKIVAGDAVVDNIRDGRTGNLVASISLDNGRLRTAVRESLETLSLTSLATHPVTGLRFEDVVLPHWAEACELVRHASRSFAPLRVLGWDVALTPHGPVIVEANMWWGPPNQVGAMPEIMRAVADNPGTTQNGGTR